MARPRMPVVQGPQQWRLIRTDRDGASVREIPQLTAAAVRYFVLHEMGMGAKHELVPTGENEWRFGPVRPLKVLSVSHSPQVMLPGRRYVDRQKTVPGTVPTVRGQHAWFVLVEFWWRQPDITIDYPAMREGMFGRTFELNGADWVLDAAQLIDRPKEVPSDDAWGDVMKDRIVNAVDDVSVAAGASALALLAILYLLNRRQN